MKVDGQQQYFWFNSDQQHKEATIKREQEPWSFMNPFGREKLTLDAGDGDDTIHVKKTGDDEYSVNINGQEFTLTKEEMKNLTIKGGAGNDNIVIDPSVDVPITVKGGAGDDNIVNLANGTTIDGGSGKDSILSFANDCVVRGGTGADAITVFGNGNKTDTKDFWSAFFSGDEPDQVQVFGFNNNQPDPFASWGWNSGPQTTEGEDE